MMNETRNETCIFPTFLEPKDFSDFTIIVEGTKLHVHKSNLAMVSPVLSMMLKSDFSEARTQQMNMPGKTLKQVTSFLQLIYPMPPPIFVDFGMRCYKPRPQCVTLGFLEDAHGLLSIAQEYQVDCLTARIEQALVDYESVSLDLLLLAQEFALTKLKEKCLAELPNSYNFADHIVNRKHPRYNELDLNDLVQLLENHIKGTLKAETLKCQQQHTSGDNTYGCL